MSKEQPTSTVQAEPVVLTAVPVNAQATTSNQVHQATVVEGHPIREPRSDLERMGLENDEVRVCRRCRRQFIRPPNVHDGQAAYYQCPECVGLKAEDIYNSFCAIS